MKQFISILMLISIISCRTQNEEKVEIENRGNRLRIKVNTYKKGQHIIQYDQSFNVRNLNKKQRDSLTAYILDSIKAH